MKQYRKSPRAGFLDYDNGDYFITICTKDRKHFFGEIVDGCMILSPIGKFLDDQLRNVGNFTEEIKIVVYVVMPNHVQAIVSLDNNKLTHERERVPNPSLRANPTFRRHIPTLSKYVSSLKGSVTKFAKSLNMEFAWQPRYHDHWIRGNKDGNYIYEYIINNVAKWQEDCFNPNVNTVP